MQYDIQNNSIIYRNVTDYDLHQTFLCGQAFRFDEYRDGFKGFIGSHLCYITLCGENLTVEFFYGKPTDTDAVAIGQFLSLDMDYAALKKQFAQDEKLAAAMEFAPGIRVLNQNFFETLITFIISQNNNIPRIKKLCDALSERYGTQVGDSFAFPTAQQLAQVTQEDYREMRFGFRAKYLADAVAKVLDGTINEGTVKSLDYPAAQQYLMQISGVGPKVADCVLLFSCRQYSSVPKDVWIKRAIATLYPDGFPDCCAGYEGIAQQYIFHWARHNLKE
ncbi:MAG: DNA-3-methyladenine glycosylase 2 family protein [Oscillospiraceae bacterium]|nr:DNA-3-methyladenine glycosylase 2 family protein [Oscillospiraceae bacterium]